MRKLRIAVSGIGWCGCEHIKAFQSLPDCEVVLLHGRDAGRIRANLSKYGVPDCAARISTRVEDLAEAPDIDVVSIAGVNSTHAPIAVAAANAGKHLMIEKPAALDEKELASLLSAVRNRGVKTVVSFELYWNPLFHLARWLIASGRMGKVMFVRSNYHSRVDASYPGWNWCRTRAEGRSFLLAAGCHSVDAVRSFLGNDAASVSAFHSNGLEQGYEFPTTIMANIRFAHGRIGQVSASADVATPYHFGLEIYGERLSLVNQYLRSPGGEQSAEELRQDCPVQGVEFFDEPYSETVRQIRVGCILPNSVRVDHHPFGDEAAALVDAIRGDGETPLSLEQAAVTHRICYAADCSASDGGRVVDVARDSSRPGERL